MRWLSLLVLGAAAFAPIGEARACSCMKQTLEEGRAQSQAIFEGTVTKIAPNTATQFRGLEVELTVKRAWKGVESGEVAVLTASNGAVCGYPFSEGATYLVYAYRDKAANQFRVSLCSLTKPIDQAKADLKHLGKPISTSPKERCAASPGTNEGGALGLIALLIAGFALVSRRS